MLHLLKRLEIMAQRKELNPLIYGVIHLIIRILLIMLFLQLSLTLLNSYWAGREWAFHLPLIITLFSWSGYLLLELLILKSSAGRTINKSLATVGLLMALILLLVQ